MKRVIITCNLEDLDFIIKNLVVKNESEFKEVQVPVEITDEPENYKFLCKSDKVIDWEFDNDYYENEEKVKEEKEWSAVTKETTEEKESGFEFDAYTKLKSVYECYITHPSIIPGTSSWISMVNKYSSETKKFLESAGTDTNNFHRDLINRLFKQTITFEELANIISSLSGSNNIKFEEFISKIYGIYERGN